MVCTASVTSAQQSKARRVYGSYIQAVDKSVDKFVRVDFVVDKVVGLWMEQITRYTLYPQKYIAIKTHFIMQKCVFYAFFNMFRWEIFWTPQGQIMRVIYIIPVFLCRKWGYFPKMERISREKIA